MQRTNEDIDRNEARIEKMDEGLIPRSEFELGMKAIEQRLEFQKKLIDQNSEEIGRSRTARPIDPG
ncbi:hypothetical protein F9K94_16480 [Brucella tritici]|uniref:Uncharacterized protein n=1 Tax=Brucella tritici TaxID=94626 RepID=A0A7V7VSW7_9HYPH|nr:hypothetical protein [Brucella tritici]KAB2656109.1 hypothetical protein F9K94_16480 [Brucella tritici]